MIIDCHTHLNHYEDESVHALPQTLGKLLEEMARNQIDYACVLTSYKHSPGRPSLQEVVHATRDVDNIFVIAGMSFLNRDSWKLEELREYIQQGKVRGVKFYCGYEPFYPNDPAMLPVIEMAMEYELPVFVHCGDTYSPSGRLKYAHPLTIDDFAVDHPDLKIVICHLGNPWVRDTMEVIYKNKNVYTDISGLVLGEFTRRFEKFMVKQIKEMAIFGVDPRKILYGTDWPISSMSSYRKFVESLKLSDAHKNQMLFENAKQLLRI